MLDKLTQELGTIFNQSMKNCGNNQSKQLHYSEMNAMMGVL